MKLRLSKSSRLLQRITFLVIVFILYSRNKLNNLSPSIIAELFEQRNENYNLRNNNPFTIPAVRTVHHGSESISFLGPKIWNILPDNIKNAESLNVFKTKIKSWKPETCPCRLCRVYVQNVGFV